MIRKTTDQLDQHCPASPVVIHCPASPVILNCPASPVILHCSASRKGQHIHPASIFHFSRTPLVATYKVVKPTIGQSWCPSQNFTFLFTKALNYILNLLSLLSLVSTYDSMCSLSVGRWMDTLTPLLLLVVSIYY